MQNVVMATRDEAQEARCAPFELAVCDACDFAFNQVFDPNALEYGVDYDNNVPSAVFTSYYEEIARYLASRYDLTKGRVYDVGCGKGTFLDVLCGGGRAARGVGVDPSCEPRVETDSNPVTLVRDVFQSDSVHESPSLVVCRHVLEHIDAPVRFARAIAEALHARGAVPLFAEVPDLDWILDNEAFWDFCYEHCNYFTRRSFGELLSRAGFKVRATQTAFGGQYRWAEGVCGDDRPIAVEPPTGAPISERVGAYARAEHRRIASARERIIEARRNGVCVLWGMATKGVVFANLVDPECEILSAGIDLNTRKHGRFIPGSGHAIHGPEWLKGVPRESVTVFIMNPNYAGEIRQCCADMGIPAKFVSP